LYRGIILDANQGIPLFFMKTHQSQLQITSPILFTCEHASARIPEQYGTLGVSRKVLQQAKDLYDPGALELMRALATDFQASFIYAHVSRLVIDYNRRLDTKLKAKNAFHAPALKTEILVGTGNQEQRIILPLNRDAVGAEEQKRHKQFVRPYQQQADRMIKQLLHQHDHVYIISVHSFYPFYNGQKRTVDIDVLYDRSYFGKKLIQQLRAQHSHYGIAANKPWSLKDAQGGILNAWQLHPNVSLVAIDVKNDLLLKVVAFSGIRELVRKSLTTLIFKA
jgi:predicted N-formylglutamate amidohydrolase